jgi:hypothetical protein
MENNYNVTKNEELLENDTKSVQIENENDSNLSNALDDTMSNTTKLNKLNMLRIPELMNNEPVNNRNRSKSFRTDNNSSASNEERRFSHSGLGFNKNYQESYVSK